MLQFIRFGTLGAEEMLECFRFLFLFYGKKGVVVIAKIVGCDVFFNGHDSLAKKKSLHTHIIFISNDVLYFLNYYTVM